MAMLVHQRVTYSMGCPKLRKLPPDWPDWFPSVQSINGWRQVAVPTVLGTSPSHHSTSSGHTLLFVGLTNRGQKDWRIRKIGQSFIFILFLWIAALSFDGEVASEIHWDSAVWCFGDPNALKCGASTQMSWSHPGHPVFSGSNTHLNPLRRYYTPSTQLVGHMNMHSEVYLKLLQVDQQHFSWFP